MGPVPLGGASSLRHVRTRGRLAIDKRGRQTGMPDPAHLTPPTLRTIFLSSSFTCSQEGPRCWLRGPAGGEAGGYFQPRSPAVEMGVTCPPRLGFGGFRGSQEHGLGLSSLWLH